MTTNISSAYIPLHFSYTLEGQKKVHHHTLNLKNQFIRHILLYPEDMMADSNLNIPDLEEDYHGQMFFKES